jgi:hypothetical protein
MSRILSDTRERMSRRPRHVVNGRLVPRTHGMLGSWYSRLWNRRTLTVLVLLFSFAITNPANDPWTVQYVLSGRRLSPHLPPSRRLPKESGYVTNYGVFALQERLTYLRIHVLGMTWDCSYVDEETGALCLEIQERLAYAQRPLLWDSSDRAFSTYRLLSTGIVLSALLTYCAYGPLRSGYAVVDWYLELLRPHSDHVTLWSTLWSLVQANWFVYPALLRMEQLVSSQSSTSWFYMANDGWNFAMSAVCIVSLTAVVRALATHRQRQHTRFAGSHPTTTRTRSVPGSGWSLLVSAFLGYLRGAQRDPFAATVLLWGNAVEVVPLSWCWLLWILAIDGLPTVLFWVLSNWSGAALGAYQLQQYRGYAGHAANLWRSLHQTFGSFWGKGRN